MKTYLVFLSICLGFLSCKKDPGEGGLAKIQGKLYGYVVSSNGIKRDSGYVQEQRVYISYGNTTVLNDDIRTGVDGSYEFKDLQKGDYTIWVFGDCPLCPMKQMHDSVLVSITEKRETVVLRDLITYRD